MLCLSHDLLALVAQHVVESGEALWMSLVCRACHDAVLAASHAMELPPTTKLKTAFSSILRLRASMRIENLSTILMANNEALGSESLPESVDRLYLWSPVAAYSMAAGASVEVLNYAWHGWKLSSIADHPFPCLKLLSRFGRTDLLDHVFTNKDNDFDITFFKLLRLNFDGLPPSVQWVENMIIVPALVGANIHTLKWYYTKMEGFEELSSNQSIWRSQFASLTSLHRLVGSAFFSHRVFHSLTLVLWIWTHFGCRAPSRTHIAQEAIVFAAFALACRHGGSINVWLFLKSHWPQGLHLLLVAFWQNVNNTAPANTPPISKLHGLAFAQVSLCWYNWAVTEVHEGGWLHCALCDTAEWCYWEEPPIISADESLLAKRAPRACLAACTMDTIRVIIKKELSRSAASEYEEVQSFHEDAAHAFRARWVSDLSELALLAFSDLLLYSTEWHNDFMDIAMCVLSVDRELFGKAICRFADLQGKSPWRSQVFDHLMPIVVACLKNENSCALFNNTKELGTLYLNRLKEYD